ncbi:type I restriction endonuclease subunit R [Leptolyngbya cf. ectocarpi LEGE 11479]|uniref:Type I restriction endonuclease subunit R n=1 Tax=Leptolyngbya cf. ectocarpi LEGE 11479 TaxID=1828722 RepID=A0A928X3E8_LEPEC|nr:type I restriction endonuclease subunit R [Leptolyngbya ectocarpi]MBE9067041.1 type I restriction endonuclease subunit R [Leptolyngbya cf. ectocarpi LEGE 11479]
MTAALGVTDRIKTLNDLETQFNLQQAESDAFFDEWLTDLPDLTSAQELGVERLKNRYDYHRAEGLLLEGTINAVVLSPLLELAGFLDPPFRLKSPYGISLELDDPDETIRGFIDTLIVQERLWIMVVESKRTSIPVPAAFPQLLAYMLASPQSEQQPEQPVYGMATNGDEFVFLKLVGQRYDTSRTFSLFPRRHELSNTLSILQRLGNLVAA